MIVVDWGTSSFRACRLGNDGAVLDRRSGPHGIMHVPDGRFADTLRNAAGDWLDAGEDRVLLCGMIGSRQGWIEAPYVACPAGLAELSAALVDVPFDGAQVKLVPGVATTDQSGVAEVIRGEETQILGALGVMGTSGVACLPGTHSKWVHVEDRRIAGFTTHMTGEVFGALRGHTILGRMMKDRTPDAPGDDGPFVAGVRRSGDPGGLLHHIFGVRSQALFGKLAESETADYLSGIVIGHEVRAALGDSSHADVHLIGAPELTARYAQALAVCGAQTVTHDADASVRGLALIGEHAPWP